MNIENKKMNGTVNVANMEENNMSTENKMNGTKNAVAANMEENNMENWKKVFGNKMAELTGFYIGSDHIHSDEDGWYYYIQKKSLLEKHPLLLNHYRGPLFVVIPYKEYYELENGTMDPEQYIDEAFWSFGYFWGGGSMLGGSFWQPLEEGTGIHNKEVVNRYLRILSCRTSRNSSGHLANEETCTKCPVQKCPFSRFPVKNENASWDNEVKEHDYREDLYLAMKERISEELNLKAFSPICYDGENALLIPNVIESECCSLYLPVSLTNDILYHPGDRDWKKIAQSLKFELGVFWKEERIIIGDECEVPKSEFCRNFWSAFGITDQWYKKDEQEEEPEEVQEDTQEKENFATKMKNFFGKFFR